MHPYEIKVQMQERGQDRLVKGNASVYDTVERLAKGGYVEAQETSREGRRPERTVYRITDRGRDQMHEWLREMLSEPSPELPQLSAALMFNAGSSCSKPPSRPPASSSRRPSTPMCPGCS